MPRPVRFILFPAGALLCAISFLFDGPVIAWVAAHPSRPIRQVAQFFTRWGDFPPIVVLLLLLLLVAWLLKRPFFTRILLLMLGSAIVGGLAANILRVLTGRARPSAKVPPGWYGLRDHGAWIAGSYGYSSFPSAHTAVAIACIVPLWLLALRPPPHRHCAFPPPSSPSASPPRASSSMPTIFRMCSAPHGWASSSRRLYAPGLRLGHSDESCRFPIPCQTSHMTYPVFIIESEEGFAVGCPALPGCWTEGKTREEARANIREAIALWLEVEEEDSKREFEASGVSYSRESVTV